MKLNECIKKALNLCEEEGLEHYYIYRNSKGYYCSENVRIFRPVYMIVHASGEVEISVKCKRERNGRTIIKLNDLTMGFIKGGTL